jgi:hypothetical protein
MAGLSNADFPVSGPLEDQPFVSDLKVQSDPDKKVCPPGLHHEARFGLHKMGILPSVGQAENLDTLAADLLGNGFQVRCGGDYTYKVSGIKEPVPKKYDHHDE